MTFIKAVLFLKLNLSSLEIMHKKFLIDVCDDIERIFCAQILLFIDKAHYFYEFQFIELALKSLFSFFFLNKRSLNKFKWTNKFKVDTLL